MAITTLLPLKRLILADDDILAFPKDVDEQLHEKNTTGYQNVHQF